MNILGMVSVSATADQHAALGLILQLAHALDLSARRELRTLGLTPAQYQLLLQVHGRPGTLQQEVGERLGVTKGNVSMIVTRLVTQKLLVRVVEGTANRLELSQRGQALVELALPRQEAWTRERFVALSSAETEQLLTLLRKLRR